MDIIIPKATSDSCPRTHPHSGAYDDGTFAMELALGAPEARWRVAHRQLHARVRAEPAVPQEIACSVTLLSEGRAAPNWLPFRLRMEPTAPAKDDDAMQPLERVVFRVFSRHDESALLSEHARALRDCVPLLTEGQIEWTDELSWHEVLLWNAAGAARDDPGQDRSEAEEAGATRAHLQKARRQTGPTGSDLDGSDMDLNAVSSLLVYGCVQCPLSLQLALHQKAMAWGLTPPILAAFFGVAATSPVWVPLTLVLGVLGFPLWVVLGTALAFVAAAATVSTAIAIRIARSQHMNDFLRGPHGQMLLFKSDVVDGRVQSLVAQLSALAAQYVADDKTRKLLASLAIDFVGNATFALPLVGELADWVWAPISAALVSTLYSDSSPHLKYVAFIEEWLPFTDFIPTATIGWVVENGLPLRELLSSLRV